jgi:formylmethanofuran dehydrogenase subunit B
MVEVTDVVCSLCGCVCDDIVVEVEDNKVTKVKRGACSVGKSKLMLLRRSDKEGGGDISGIAKAATIWLEFYGL